MSAPPLDIRPILNDLHPDRDRLRPLRETILANAVMIGEIPAPSGGEEQRVRFVVDRFRESQLQSISTDEAGNGVGVIPGETGDDGPNILIVSHADTIADANTSHTMTLGSDSMQGAGIADNSIGLAILISLPDILRLLDIKLGSNLYLLATTRSIGHANLEGLSHFIHNVKTPFRAGVCLEGVELGRLSYSAMGMLRAEIVSHTPEESVWPSLAPSAAIATMTQVVNRILGIAVPLEPKTSIVLGSLRSGTGSFKTPAQKAVLRLEIRSEDAGIVQQISERLHEIIEEVSADSGAAISMDEVSRRIPGGIPFSHPLVKATRQIMESLALKPTIEPSMSELSLLIDRGIPGVTLGITKGEGVGEAEQSIQIEPMFSGIAQLLGVLKAIDQGICDEN